MAIEESDSGTTTDSTRPWLSHVVTHTPPHPYTDAGTGRRTLQILSSQLPPDTVDVTEC